MPSSRCPFPLPPKMSPRFFLLGPTKINPPSLSKDVIFSFPYPTLLRVMKDPADFGTAASSPPSYFSQSKMLPLCPPFPLMCLVLPQQLSRVVLLRTCTCPYKQDLWNSPPSVQRHLGSLRASNPPISCWKSPPSSQNSLFPPATPPPSPLDATHCVPPLPVSVPMWTDQDTLFASPRSHSYSRPTLPLLENVFFRGSPNAEAVLSDSFLFSSPKIFESDVKRFCPSYRRSALFFLNVWDSLFPLPFPSRFLSTIFRVRPAPPYNPNVQPDLSPPPSPEFTRPRTFRGPILRFLLLLDFSPFHRLILKFH